MLTDRYFNSYKTKQRIGRLQCYVNNTHLTTTSACNYSSAFYSSLITKI